MGQEHETENARRDEYGLSLRCSDTIDHNGQVRTHRCWLYKLRLQLYGVMRATHWSNFLIVVPELEVSFNRQSPDAARKRHTCTVTRVRRPSATRLRTIASAASNWPDASVEPVVAPSCAAFTQAFFGTFASDAQKPLLQPPESGTVLSAAHQLSNSTCRPSRTRCWS